MPTDPVKWKFYEKKHIQSLLSKQKDNSYLRWHEMI